MEATISRRRRLTDTIPCGASTCTSSQFCDMDLGPSFTEQPSCQSCPSNTASCASMGLTDGGKAYCELCGYDLSGGGGGMGGGGMGGGGQGGGGGGGGDDMNINDMFPPDCQKCMGKCVEKFMAPMLELALTDPTADMSEFEAKLQDCFGGCASTKGACGFNQFAELSSQVDTYKNDLDTDVMSVNMDAFTATIPLGECQECADTCIDETVGPVVAKMQSPTASPTDQNDLDIEGPRMEFCVGCCAGIDMGQMMNMGTCKDTFYESNPAMKSGATSGDDDGANVGMIVGIVVGVLVACCVIGIIVFFVCGSKGQTGEVSSVQ